MSAMAVESLSAEVLAAMPMAAAGDAMLTFTVECHWMLQVLLLDFNSMTLCSLQASRRFDQLEEMIDLAVKTYWSSISS
jgi:hypothetical protein